MPYLSNHFIPMILNARISLKASRSYHGVAFQAAGLNMLHLEPNSHCKGVFFVLKLQQRRISSQTTMTKCSSKMMRLKTKFLPFCRNDLMNSQRIKLKLIKAFKLKHDQIMQQTDYSCMAKAPTLFALIWKGTSYLYISI